jgi:Flp pilus assembly protein CpaB
MLLLYTLACLEPERVVVVVAARDLSVGVPIEAGDVYGFAMDPRFVPKGVFYLPDDVIGRVPYERILANEPIRAGRLADADLQRQLEALVPRDHTVVVFGLDPGADPPLPGRDRVDVRANGRVVATGLEVHRIDRDQVAAIASPDQVRAIDEARPNAVMTVRIGSER